MTITEMLDAIDDTLRLCGKVPNKQSLNPVRNVDNGLYRRSC